MINFLIFLNNFNILIYLYIYIYIKEKLIARTRGGGILRFEEMVLLQ
jgi:hypothetical protein